MMRFIRKLNLALLLGHSVYSLSVSRGGFDPGGVSWMSTSLSSGGCFREAIDGWPSGNGLTCMEASLCVSICCGLDS